MSKAKQPAKPRVKAGTSKLSAEDRKAAFVEAYLSNGMNATQAALAAGYSASGAPKQGYRMSKDPSILSILEKRRQQLASEQGLNTDRLVREIGRLAFADPRKIMHPDGRIKLPHELDDDTAAAIASFKVDIDGNIEYKFWDKNSAQERASKIHGLFERDNKQKNPLGDFFESLSGAVMGVAKVSDDDESENG